MRIGLVNPRGASGRMVAVPHGILQLHAELTSRGHEACIIDYNTEQEKRSAPDLNRFDLVGLSVMSSQLRHATAIADSLKKTARVVWGGVHCLLDPESILRKYPEHSVVSGDGEVALLCLIEHLEGRQPKEWLEEQPGICLWQGKERINPPSFVSNLDELADIDYRALPYLSEYTHRYDFYFQRKIGALNVLSGRGCNWDCSFCINSIYRKHHALYRKKSIAKIGRETGKVMDDLGLRIVHLQDEDFFCNLSWAESWAALAREKGYLWAANGRYNYFSASRLNEERLKAFVDSGLFSMGMSVESGCETLRNNILNKQLRDRQIEEAITRIRNSVGPRLCVNTSFIVFFPGDTAQNRIQTIKWMNHLSRRINISFSGPQIYRRYPGSRLYNLEGQSGSRNVEDYIRSMSPDGSEKTMRGRHEGLFYAIVIQKYFNRRFRFPRLLEMANGRLQVQAGEKAGPDSVRMRLLLFAIALFAIPITARLRLNFWRFFVEPKVLGVLVTAGAKFWLAKESALGEFSRLARWVARGRIRA